MIIATSATVMLGQKIMKNYRKTNPLARKGNIKNDYHLKQNSRIQDR